MFAKRLMVLSASAMLALPLLFCADPAQSPDSGEAEAAQLKQRIRTIVSTIRIQGSAPTVEQVQQLELLNSQIRDWQSRTGRSDIRVTDHRKVSPLDERSGEVTSNLQRGPVNPFCSGRCPATPNPEPLGQFCVLKSSQCVNGMRICIYVCYVVE
jgi:hypothetical protein